MHALPSLPSPRGPISAAVVAALGREPGAVPRTEVPRSPALDDDDLHLGLYCMYELHYRGFDGVDAGWEWQPDLLALRGRLEQRFLDGLRSELGELSVSADDVRDQLIRITTTGGGPSLSGYIRDEGSLDEMREFCIHRSAYQLKEADPHTWAIPRINGRAKAALLRIQSDEYGDGDAAEMHATLFADTMRGLDLDDRYGAYLDRIPGVTLATVNLVSMLGLHRRWRGALLGHLAVFEMTSEGPMGRYSEGLRRLGAGAEARRFYDVHVEADAIHKHIALDDMVGPFLEDEPDLAADVVFGARALTLVERRFTEHLLGSWRAGRSSLRAPAAEASPGRGSRCGDRDHPYDKTAA